MDWKKLIAQLDERHQEDVYEFVTTVIAFQVASSEGPLFSFSGFGAYVSHASKEINLLLGQTDSVTWFGKMIKLTPENTKRAEIISTKELVLDVLELMNKRVEP